MSENLSVHLARQRRSSQFQLMSFCYWNILNKDTLQLFGCLGIVSRKLNKEKMINLEWLMLNTVLFYSIEPFLTLLNN